MEGAKDAADAEGESLRVMNRCMKIASNIMSGKRVPLKDLKYLMEHDSKLYQMAMVMRRPNKDDKNATPSSRRMRNHLPTGRRTPGRMGRSPPRRVPQVRKRRILRRIAERMPNDFGRAFYTAEIERQRLNRAAIKR